MKNPLAIAVFGVVCPFLSFAQPGDSLNGPRVWLASDRSEFTASGWSDLTVYKNHAISFSASSTPSPDTLINFNKAIVFDGIDDYLTIPFSPEQSAELSILTVFQAGDTLERGLWGTEKFTTRNVFLTTRQVSGPDTISDIYGKGERATVLNSVLQNWDKSQTVQSEAVMSLGRAGSDGKFLMFRGALAEMLVFNRSLSFLERVQYETYLAIKYGTGLKGGNFVSSAEKVLWNVSENVAFGRNIAGIGRDDAFTLHQRQSGSAYDTGLLVISAGSRALTNFENPSALNDQDFIIWGDNGMPLNTRPGTGADSILSFIQRKWLVTATGASARHISTELHIDAERFSSDPMGYWLVIDRSGQEDFSADNLEYILPSTSVNNKVVYKNIHWDPDGSGKDHFGFARARDLFAVVRKLQDPSCTNQYGGQIRIEIVSGKAPYHLELAGTGGKLLKSWRSGSALQEESNLAEGSYFVKLTDGTGESISRSFELVEPDALAISLGPDQVFSSVNPIVLDVSAQVPDTTDVTYRWENSFGFNSDDKSIVVPETGVYRVFVTRPSDGCVFTDDIAITGAESQRVAVYPTILGVSESYSVSVSLEETSPVLVRIFNASGMTVGSIEGRDNSEYQFITPAREPGLFMVVIQTPKRIETRKLIVH